jgi:nitrogen fixation/metabolism regulation signal transduction histidine kinase/CheY-like chemotaxis protein
VSKKNFNFSSVRIRLIGVVLLLVIPAWLVMYIFHLPMSGFVVGLIALGAAWVGGERFVLRQIRVLSDTAKKITGGNISARTGLKTTADEIGQLTKLFDHMAESLDLRIKELQKKQLQLQELAAFVQLNPNAAMKLAADGTLLYFNDAAQQFAVAVEKKHPGEILPANIKQIVEDCLHTGRSKMHLETMLGNRTFSWSFHPVLPSRFVHCYAEDITERLSLAEQLRQSQKMESVGQLAAGIAHDFNNMLTVIQGHSSSLLAKPTLPPQISDSVQAIYFAAERATSLTRQLLMFSRKNVIQTRLLDLRDVINDMEKMLKLLLGENITLQFKPPDELPLVPGDAGMIGQIIMNLSVNARDAMPNGGVLEIRTDVLHIDDACLETHTDARIGRFVRLQVSDTGCGMATETLIHIFEPFFTTKEVGKGTGLGLATVYGIVKQHDGWIEVNTEPDCGTTFTVFFPAGEETKLVQEVPATSAFTPGGTETILVVEDESVVREMAREILEDCGYRIFEAASGREALQVWDQRTRNIDLLLTDMVMPEDISGLDLALRLMVEQPQLKIIFTSGYAANEINAEVLAKTNAHFLQKPYDRTNLTQAVRDCLDTNANDVTPLHAC